MSVSVLVPWTAGCPHREAAWRWVQEQYATHHPDWEVVTGACTPGPYSRSEAILDAMAKSSGDVLVVADSDVWCDPAEAIHHVAERGWTIPHSLIHRLSADSTTAVLDGADWRGLPLSSDNQQDRRAYRGNETGTLFVALREVLLDVPPDPRFRGWGSEDSAHGIALRYLVGEPWRGTDDLVHLWHPPQPRLTRRVGTAENNALYGRYLAARHRPERLRALVDEGRSAPA